MTPAPLGLACIGGPLDGDRHYVPDHDVGDVHLLNGCVYVVRWWPHYDEAGLECGASKCLVAPGVRVPCKAA